MLENFNSGKRSNNIMKPILIIYSKYTQLCNSGQKCLKNSKFLSGNLTASVYVSTVRILFSTDIYCVQHWTACQRGYNSDQ